MSAGTQHDGTGRALTFLGSIPFASAVLLPLRLTTYALTEAIKFCSGTSQTGKHFVSRVIALRQQLRMEDGGHE